MAPSPHLTIRPRRPSDLPALIPIHHAVFAQTGYPVEGPFELDSEIISFISPRDAYGIWVAELGPSSTAGGGTDENPQSQSQPPQTESTSSPSETSRFAPRIVGHVALQPYIRNAREAVWAAAGNTPENSANLGRLFVSPDAQGHGVGRALVQTVMEWAERNGLRLGMYVVTKDVAAVRLYERLGWHRIGMVTHEGWDNWMYVWHPVENSEVDRGMVT